MVSAQQVQATLRGSSTWCLVLFLVLGLRKTIQGLRDFQSLYIEGFVLLFSIEKKRTVSGVLQVFDRKA
jgi:hypothetical protein